MKFISSKCWKISRQHKQRRKAITNI